MAPGHALPFADEPHVIRLGLSYLRPRAKPGPCASVSRVVKVVVQAPQEMCTTLCDYLYTSTPIALP